MDQDQDSIIAGTVFILNFYIDGTDGPLKIIH